MVIIIMEMIEKKHLVAYLREYAAVKKNLTDLKKEIPALQSWIAHTEQGPNLKQLSPQNDYLTLRVIAVVAFFFVIMSLLGLLGGLESVCAPILVISSLALSSSIIFGLILRLNDRQTELDNQRSIEKNRQDSLKLDEKKQRLREAEETKSTAENRLRVLDEETVFTEKKYQDYADALADYLASGRADTIAEAEQRLEHLWKHKAAHEKVCYRLQQLSSMESRIGFEHERARAAASEARFKRAEYDSLTKDYDE